MRTDTNCDVTATFLWQIFLLKTAQLFRISDVNILYCIRRKYEPGFRQHGHSYKDVHVHVPVGLILHRGNVADCLHARGYCLGVPWNVASTHSYCPHWGILSTHTREQLAFPYKNNIYTKACIHSTNTCRIFEEQLSVGLGSIILL